VDSFNVADLGKKILKNMKIKFPIEIVFILNQILKYIPRSSDEFAVAFKGTIKKNNGVPFVVIEDITDFYVPKQEVTTASVNFKEQIPEKYNVILHRHPAGCRSFSGTDEASLNDEFLASILFIPPFEFPQALINYPITKDGAASIRINAIPELTITGDFEIESKVQDKFKSPAVAKLQNNFNFKKFDAKKGKIDAFDEEDEWEREIEKYNYEHYGKGF